MTKTAKGNPDDVVKAFRKAAKELGCCGSEERFQKELFVIGRNKPARQGKRTKPSAKATSR
jgi:hypothetical protein